jgi:hypothetical protein
LYNFHSIQRARAPLALRENKKKEPFFQSTSLIPTQSANTRKKHFKNMVPVHTSFKKDRVIAEKEYVQVL